MQSSFVTSTTKFIDEPLLKVTNIAQKHGLRTFIGKILAKKLPLQNLSLLKHCSFKALEEKTRLEFLTNTALNEISNRDKTNLMEGQVIFHFLELMRNHELCLTDVNDNATSMLSDNQLPLEDVDLESVSCTKDSNDCVTLVVDEKRCR